MFDHTSKLASLKTTETWPKEMLNSPERILQEIKDAQKIIVQQNCLIDELKDELDQHLKNGDIQDKYEHNGITASLRERKYWVYSDEVTKLKRKEEIDDIATKKTTSYWQVR